MQIIDHKQLKEIQSHDTATIVNVLPAEAFRETHIPGSVNIPHEHANFAEEVARVLAAKDAPVVLYCSSDQCSASKNAAQKLVDAGFTNVMCYEGGYKEWKEQEDPRAAA